MTYKELMRKLEKFIIVNYPEFYAEHLGESWSVAIIKLIKKLEKEKQQVYKNIKFNSQKLKCGTKGEVVFLDNCKSNLEKEEFYHTIYKNEADDLEWYAFNQKELEEFLTEKYNFCHVEELKRDLKDNKLIIIKGSKQINFKL